MRKYFSVFSYSALLFLILTIFSQPSAAAQSRAQLYMPWPMLNAKLNNALGGSSSQFSTKVPFTTLDAGGLVWSVTNIEYVAATSSPVSKTDGKQVSFEANASSLKVNIEKIAVDQVIERDINGVTVRIHLKADCGPLTFTQPQAAVSSIFAIDWSTGTPVAALQKSDLNWLANSWTISDFACNGPEGLPQMLKEEISDRLKNAEDFKPYLTEFLSSEVHALITSSLKKVREPLTVSTGSSQQTFKVGALVNLPQGIVANLTVDDGNNNRLLSPLPAPPADILNSLSQTTPSFLAGKDLLEQIIRGELSKQANSVRIDLQTIPSFRSVMQSRLKQFFGWSGLMKFPKNSPFPLTMLKPSFNGLNLNSLGKLTTNFELKGVVQAYRADQWWDWITVNGQAAAEVELTVANGVIAYKTKLAPSKTKIEYGQVYKERFNRNGSPPSSKILAAVSGNQPGLSGSFKFPVVDVAHTGGYKLSALKWLNSQNFVLSFKEN